jgi:hypothetical protein
MTSELTPFNQRPLDKYSINAQVMLRSISGAAAQNLAQEPWTRKANDDLSIYITLVAPFRNLN